LFDEICRENEKNRVERTARAKADAAARGKEPFDLAKLETLVDPGRMVRAKDRQRDYEYSYYVEHPKFTTLAELAVTVKAHGTPRFQRHGTRGARARDRVGACPERGRDGSGQRGRRGLPGFLVTGASGTGSFSSFGLSLGR